MKLAKLIITMLERLIDIMHLIMYFIMMSRIMLHTVLITTPILVTPSVVKTVLFLPHIAIFCRLHHADDVKAISFQLKKKSCPARFAISLTVRTVVKEIQSTVWGNFHIEIRDWPSPC